MYGDGVGQLQLFQLRIRIFHHALLVKFNGHSLCMRVNLPDHSHISVKNTDSLLHRNSVFSPDFPFHLVIILGLHHFVALTEPVFSLLMLLLGGRGGIQVFLKNLVQPLHSQQPFPHRGQHLNLRGFGPHIGRQLLANQLNDNADDHICVIPLQEEKVPALIVQNNLLTAVDLMSVDYNIAL